MDTIRVEFSEDGLFGGWENMALYDVEASKAAYGELLEAELRSVFGNAEIEVVSGINDRVRINETADDPDVPAVQDVVSEVYQDYEWVRYTQEGVKANLSEGLWTPLGDGVICGMAEVELDDGTPAYQMTYLKGENSPYDTTTFHSIEDALWAMEQTADWSDWRTQTD